MSRILVISPHPDDEVIGCGGTLLRHVASGDRVRTLFLTSGERGGHGRSPEETAALREAEARRASEILGIEEIDFWRAPDGKLRARREWVGNLHALLRAWRPGRVYVPHPREQHPDHRAAGRLLRTALRGLPDPPAVWLYEVWTPLAAIDEIVDISEHIETKLTAIRAHASQVEVLRFDEAACGLARYRGEMHSWPGGPYAEVFGRGCP